MTVNESWVRVAYARSRDEVMRQFAAWNDKTGAVPREEDVRLNWGRHADGGDYWEILHRADGSNSPRAG